MNIKFSLLRIVTLAVAMFVWVVQGYGQDNMSRAEAVAQEYMTAFLRGDFEKAANLTHPDTLATLKRTFLIRLDQARAEGRQQELLKEVGIKEDVGKLRAMNPHDFYVTVVKSNRKRGDNEAFKSMKKTQVEVVSSELRSTDEAAVRVRVKIPGENEIVNRAGGLLLRKHNQYWRVRTNLE